MAVHPPLHRALSLPGLEIPGNLFLAPLAGYTDSAFRAVCRAHGAELTYTEMVSAEALARSSDRTFRLLQRAPGEDLLVVQIFAATARSAAAGAAKIAPLSPSLIDLNCGCSVPKILRAGCGAALLRNPRSIGEIVRAVFEASGIPVTVKLRLGWEESQLSYLEAAREAVRAGAVMIALHPRTRSQGFRGDAEWGHITTLKHSIAVPVIGSGDLFTAEDGMRMLQSTGCDAVMFARGAIGNPFIFSRARQLLEGKSAPCPTLRERLETALDHLLLAAASKGEERACKEMRKHMAAYVRGAPGASAIRRLASTAATVNDYEQLVRTSLDDPGPTVRRACTGLDPTV